MDDRLAITITSADGLARRWGGDEPDAEDIPMGLRFGTSIPGGFRELECDLLRRIDIDHPDLRTFDDVRCYGPGNQTAWEGRMLRTPRDHGAAFGAHPVAVGWGAHLRDFPAFSEIYVDRDPGSWTGPSLDRRITIVGLAWSMNGGYEFVGAPGLGFNGAAGVSIPNNANAEAWYAAPAGVTVAKVGYQGTQANTTNVEAATLYHDDNDTAASPTSQALTLDDTVRTATLATAERYLMLRAHATATHTPAAGSPFSRTYKKIAVYGNHGLTLRTISGEPSGVYASDVLAHMLPIAAPELAFTTGTGGSIQATTYAIPHLVVDGVTAEDVILEVNKYHQFDWAVWDDKTFHYWTPDPDTRTVWEARLSEGAHITLEGDDGEGTFNGVVAYYTDSNGVRKSVGPPAANWPSGVALADDTDATLVDTAADNPVNAHGLSRRWAKLDISTTTTAAGAITIAAAYLATRSLPTRRGTVRLTGTARHPTSGQQPVWQVRAGDYVRISDHPADVPRKIIETTYDHDTRTITCTTDNTVGLIEALLERAGVALIGVI